MARVAIFIAGVLSAPIPQPGPSLAGQWPSAILAEILVKNSLDQESSKLNLAVLAH